MHARLMIAYFLNRPSLVPGLTHGIGSSSARAFGGVYSGVGHSPVVTKIGNSVVYEYTRVFKSGNEAVQLYLSKLPELNAQHHHNRRRLQDNGTSTTPLRPVLRGNNNTNASLPTGALHLPYHRRRAAPSARRHIGTFRFTFVREPMDHFVSGFSEVMYRYNAEKARHPKVWGSHDSIAGLYTFLRESDPTAAAQSFVKAFVSGYLHHTGDKCDTHSFPQIAFLDHTVPYDFIGEMASLATCWHVMNERNGVHSPKRVWWQPVHPDTDSKSHNAAREAMSALLAASTAATAPSGNDQQQEHQHQRVVMPKKGVVANFGNTTTTRRRQQQQHRGGSSTDGAVAGRINPYREAMCRVTLLDYVCLGYPLPPDCARVLGHAKAAGGKSDGGGHNVVCPFRIPRPPEKCALRD